MFFNMGDGQDGTINNLKRKINFLNFEVYLLGGD